MHVLYMHVLYMHVLYMHVLYMHVLYMHVLYMHVLYMRIRRGHPLVCLEQPLGLLEPEELLGIQALEELPLAELLKPAGGGRWRGHHTSLQQRGIGFH